MRKINLNKGGGRSEIVILLAILLLLPIAHSFTGIGGAIETTASLGYISTSANNSAIDARVQGSMMPVGSYTGIYGGYFGLLDQQNITYAISVGQVSPEQNSGTTIRNIAFTFNTAGSTISSCSLLINGQQNATIYSPATGTTQISSVIGLGKKSWNIVCYDLSDLPHYSQSRNLTVLNANNFNGVTTNFSSADITNIINFTLEETGFGKIVFEGSTDLSDGPDIDSFIAIGNNSITINSAALPSLNKSATLTIYNLGLVNPVVMKDGLYCNECTIQSYNGNLVFNVSHFSNYYAAENSQLEIWDRTDTVIIRSGEQDLFFANYTTTATGLSINGTGVTCDIFFQDGGPYSMPFNATSYLYSYNRSIAVTGTQYFNISCIDANDIYTDINLSDALVIGDPLIPGVNITVISSERGNISSQPGGVIIQGGNVTQMNIDGTIITPSWQGYFGNISGRVTLQDPNGTVFYDWEILLPSGEVYAAISPSIDFSNINCTDNAGIAQEESFIGQAAADGDSVSKTFNTTSHPHFDVGLIQIDPNQCKSTNLYVNGATQTTKFYEVLLTDGASNIVYTAIIDPDATGFDGRPYDFEMLVGEDGHNNDQQITTYYFFMDLG